MSPSDRRPPRPKASTNGSASSSTPRRTSGARRTSPRPTAGSSTTSSSRRATRRVLEIGTSTGHSGIWEAWALSKTGGTLVTLEIEEFRHLAAVRNFKASGLDGLIDARLGDARKLIGELDGPFDFIFLDADKNWTLNYFQALLPKLATGGCFAVHGVTSLGYMKGIRDFLEYVRGLGFMETTVENAASGGISLSFRKRPGAVHRRI